MSLRSLLNQANNKTYLDLKIDSLNSNSASFGNLDHNTLNNISGGIAPNEYFHLSNSEYSNLQNILNNDIQNITQLEAAQIQNINNINISNTQWSYLGNLDQSLNTSDNVQFDRIDINGNLRINNNTLENLNNNLNLKAPTGQHINFKIDGTNYASLHDDGLHADNIREQTNNNGVNIDGVLLKDSEITGTLLTSNQPNITQLGNLTNLTIDNIDINNNKINSNTNGTDLIFEPNGNSDVKINLIDDLQYLRILKNTNTNSAPLINFVIKTKLNTGGTIANNFGSAISFDIENEDDGIDITQARILTTREGADDTANLLFQCANSGSVIDVFQYTGVSDEYIIRNPPNTGGTSLTIDTATGKIQRAVISSKRFKKNIVPTSLDTSILYNLNIVDFNYKNDENKESHTGLIAEELDKHPRLRQYLNYDKDGLVESIQYRNLCIPMLKELQNLKNNYDNLKNEINNIKNYLKL